MASFDMVIDTEPMATVMSTVGAGVLGVTGAVVAMQSAVVAQEEEAAQTISANVDRGFYMLMKSQISQKMAAMSAKISSQLLLMKKFRADILRMKELMTSDYNRIYRRYRKQFASLNKEAETRVREIDKSAMEVSEVYKHFCDTRRDSSSQVYLCADEAVRMNTLEAGALVKSKTSNALDALSANITSTMKYNKEVSHILKDESGGTGAVTPVYVGAIVTESMSMFDKNAAVDNVYLPSEHFKGGEAAQREVRQAEGAFSWQDAGDSDREKVKKAFVSEIEAHGTDERVAKEMKRLFDEGVWKVPASDAMQSISATLTGGTPAESGDGL